MSRALVVLVVLVVGHGAAAQVRWTQITTSPMPSARQSFAMCYDSARQRVVLFGGDGFGLHDDTWEWDGTTWQLQSPALRPSPRSYCSMVYDVSRGKCVIYGGKDSTTNTLTDTWEWDGMLWAHIATPQMPPPRYAVALCFDARRSRTVLFGGAGGPLPWDDTWEYDGATWRQVLTATRPYIRALACLAYDFRTARVCLFGGSSGISLSDLWEYDGVNWTLLAITGPPARDSASMDYDRARQRLVVFGGSGASGRLNDTWEWSGQSWQQRAATPAPPPRDGHRLVYDARQETLVMFGGSGLPALGDHWTYATTKPASHVGFGAACTGSGGLPLLSSLNATRPWSGEPFTILASRLPLQQPAVLELGISKSTYLGLTLPFDLGLIGMPGCSLHVSVDAALGASSGTGSAQFTLAIPSDPAVIGATFYNQVFVADPPTNLLGIIGTNAAEGRVGLK